MDLLHFGRDGSIGDLTIDRYLDTVQARCFCVSGVKLRAVHRRTEGLMVMLGDSKDVIFPFRAIPTVLGLLTETIDRVRGRRVSVRSELQNGRRICRSARRSNTTRSGVCARSRGPYASERTTMSQRATNGENDAKRHCGRDHGSHAERM